MTWVALLAQAYNRLPTIILGVITGPFSVAIWAIMGKINSPLLLIQNSMLRPLIPMLSVDRRAATISDSKLYQAARLHYFFMSTVSAIIIIHADLIVSLWLGDSYTIVSELLKIFLIIHLVPGFGVFLMRYYAQGKTQINNIYVLSNVVIGLSGSTLILLIYGLKGFVISFTVLRICLATICLIIYLKIFKLRLSDYIMTAISRPIFLLVIYGFLWSKVLSQFSSSIAGTCLSIILSCIVILILYFLIMPTMDQDLTKHFCSRCWDKRNLLIGRSSC